MSGGDLTGGKPDGVLPGERDSLPQGEKCNACVLGECYRCDKATCRGCGCKRRPIPGWPASAEAMGEKP